MQNLIQFMSMDMCRCCCLRRGGWASHRFTQSGSSEVIVYPGETPLFIIYPDSIAVPWETDPNRLLNSE